MSSESACALALVSSFAQAQDKPPLKLVVGFPPGGALDNLARALAEQLRTSTGETVLVENRPGAATRLAIDSVKRAPADGRTVLLGSSAPFVLFPMTYRRLDYDVDRDFLPVAHLVDVPTVISTASGSPYQTIATVHGVGAGSAGPRQRGPHQSRWCAPLFHPGARQGDRHPTHTGPHKGGAPLVTDLVGGHVPLATDALASQLELHRAGKVRILAVSGTQRNRALPDVPTLKESGIDAFAHANAWYGAFVPAGTPKATVLALEKAFMAAVQQPQVQSQLQRAGLEPTGLRRRICSPQAAGRARLLATRSWKRRASRTRNEHRQPGCRPESAPQDRADAEWRLGRASRRACD